MINVKKILLVLITAAALLVPDHLQVYARSKRFSGILPPQRLNKAEVVKEEAQPIEEYVSPYPDIRLKINVAAREVVVIDEGREVIRKKIAVGSTRYRTPIGPQEVKTIIWNPWWIPPNSPWAQGYSKTPPGPRNPLGPVKLMMGQGIRLHGTTKNNSIGRAASHGCLRMHNNEATEIAWYLQKRINEAEDTLLNRYQRNRSRSYHVNLQNPLPVDIVYEPVEIVDEVVHIYADIYGWGKNLQALILDTLMQNGIDIKKIDENRIAELKYPKKHTEVIKIGLTELFSSTPTKKSCVASVDRY